MEVRGAFLLVHHVPYVAETGAVETGTLVSTLSLSGDTVLRPDDHVAQFIGGQPCHKTGQHIQQIVHQITDIALAPGLVANRSFSNKPPEGYRDYHHKMTTYANIISGPAQSLDPANDPRKFIAIQSSEDDSVFAYVDTASSRAGISTLAKKLDVPRVAIIGLGGTGSYILDLISKTPVGEIHLFDADRYYSHNAFRSPGAPSLEELRKQETKVERFTNIYANMRRGVVPHCVFINPDTIHLLDGSSFAFVAIDGGSGKKFVLEGLEQRGIPYIDCGMGIEEVDGKLTGQVRITTSPGGYADHIWKKGAISFAEEDIGNEYSRNIQIADLNMLNASLAVIKWKKLMGFYLDLECEQHSIYPIDGNVVINAYSAQSSDGSQPAGLSEELA